MRSRRAVGQATTIARAAIAASALVLAMVVLLGVACGSEPAPGEGFAIYQLAADFPPAQTGALPQIEIGDAPVVSDEDIVTYTAATHDIELTAAAYNRLAALRPPVGRSFVVCVDRLPVYAGAFWAVFSSVSCDGVIILMPLSPWTAPNPCVIRLELGYPSSDWFTGADPRADPRILEALERAGKLR